MIIFRQLSGCLFLCRMIHEYRRDGLYPVPQGIPQQKHGTREVVDVRHPVVFPLQRDRHSSVLMVGVGERWSFPLHFLFHAEG